MRSVRSTLLAFVLPSLAVGCAADAVDSASSGDRGPIGKADAAGSCASLDGGDTCGDQSDAGTCWCDEACAEFGDCCSDKATVCDGAPSDLCQDFVGPCNTDADCGDGMACVADPTTCSPSACGCDPATGSVICTADCGGKECVPADPGPNSCDDFVGPCNTDADCGDGMACVADPTTCSPSACGCDPATGNVICTADCGGKECVPADPGPNSCDDFVGPCNTDADCGDGMACVADPTTCSPSACGCDPATGSVICTADCGGKECVAVGEQCSTAQDCAEQFGPPIIECVGAHWACDAGTCNQTC